MFDEKYTSNNNKHSEMKIQKKKYETKIQEKKNCQFNGNVSDFTVEMTGNDKSGG